MKRLSSPTSTILGLIGGLTAVTLAATLALTHGRVVFTLDDAYIHLALAQNLAQGHYGLNPGEAASPASSILYPFLLAPLLGLGQAAPLLLGLVATLGSGWLVCVIAREADLGLDRLPLAGLAALFVGFLLALNWIGLEFTGLEHPLQVASALACVLGAGRLTHGRAFGAIAFAGALAAPLLRYEGLALWGASLCLLASYRCWRQAAWLGIAGALLVGGFSWFLHTRGLPLLPSSVLAKSDPQGTAVVGPVRHALGILTHNLFSYGATQLIALGVLLAARLFAPARDWRFVLYGLAVIAAQIAGSGFGWFGRYEIWAFSFAAMMVCVAYAPACARWIGNATVPRCAFAAGAAIVLMYYYAWITALTPLAARNIYHQQYQMHRFAVDFYRAPVAVNDLGWVAWRNPHYVLDLWGLGSEPARRARAAEEPKVWMDRLAQAHGVGLAMIYDTWFPVVPPDWTRIAVLTTEKISTAEPDVAFYATTPAASPAIRAALAAFVPTLPAADRLAITPAAPK